MNTKLYSLRDYMSVALHYSATTAVAAGVMFLAQPWVVFVAAGLTLPQMLLSIQANKKYLENFLVEHPKEHPYSPRLGKTVEELFKASGLKSEHFPVYDFRMEEKPGSDVKKGALWEAFQEGFRKMAETPNAAALHLGKPIIMISQPLLRLLNDREEKAVLAHEFAHAAARHQHFNLPLKTMATLAGISMGLTVLVAALGTGLLAFGGALLAGAGAAHLVRKLHPAGALMTAPKEDLGLHGLHERKKVEKISGLFSSLASVGTLSLFNPLYPALWTGSRGIRATTSFLTESFSRSHEYQADAGAVTLGADPLALITALRKITALVEESKKAAWGNREVPKPGFLTAAWARATASHPTVAQRTARLADIARHSGYGEAAIDEALHAPIKISREEIIPYDTIRFLAARLV